MKILNKLYFGEINPHALKINDNNFEKLLELMSESEESLIKQLTEEQKILFEKIRDCDCEISDITEREIFIQGFKLGARLILEIMSDDMTIKSECGKISSLSSQPSRMVLFTAVRQFKRFFSIIRETTRRINFRP